MFVEMDKLYLIPVAIWLTVITYLGINTHLYGKAWRMDLKAWWKSYSNKPKVRIEAENIVGRLGQKQPILKVTGRMAMEVYVDRIEAKGDSYAAKVEW